MTVHTLPEYAKGQEDLKVRATIELFPEAVDFMGVIPFKSAPSGAYRYQEEASLPENMGFRALNEEPTAGYGLLVDRVEQTYPIAGNIDVDRRLIARHGTDRRSTEERMQIKKKASIWANTFMFGDNQSQPREFTGLKARLRPVGTGSASVDGSNYMSRVVANSQASGGGALSLSQLDRAIGLVEGCNALIMPKAIKDRFPAAQRDTNVGGYIQVKPQEFGEEQVYYRGIRIFTGYGVSKFGEFLPFNEVGFGGGAAATSSIYPVRFDETGVCAIEQSPMEVQDMGLTEGGVWYRTNIEHDVGMTVEDPFGALRLSSIANAPIVK
ncbi:hypothetical protein VWZ88_12530 [Phaeobacter sp. JH20_36]|uniref:major capsid protein n=1 Tax=unclassified Phaeobacter TaxID=2621772 RepID=UPI003A86A2B2